jgi:hypothetical protein
MKLMVALKPVFLNGKVVEAGDKFSCPDDFAKKLIASDSAELLDVDNNPNAIEERKKLAGLNKEELLKVTLEKGLDGISEKNKKDDIIEALLKEAGLNV